MGKVDELLRVYRLGAVYDYYGTVQHQQVPATVLEASSRLYRTSELYDTKEEEREREIERVREHELPARWQEKLWHVLLYCY
jgi:hypothetical protein